MASNRPLVIGGAIAAVVVALIAVILLLNSSQGATTTPQGDDAVRTQVFVEMTRTAAVIAATEQEARVVALEQTVAAQSTVIADTPEGSNSAQVVATVENVATELPPVVITATQPLPTAPPRVVTATPEPTAQGQRQSGGTVGGCSRTGDEINVGADSTGACETVSAQEVARIIDNSVGLSDAVQQLDRMCEGLVDACYQYRAQIPTVIPASIDGGQRVLWGDTEYLRNSPLDARIERLKCDGAICIYLILDNEPFSVGQAGRGLLLDQSYPGR